MLLNIVKSGEQDYEFWAVSQTYRDVSINNCTRHNSVDSLPTSDLVCTKEVTIRTTFSHMINIAGIICSIWSLVIDIQCTRYKNAFKF